MYKRQGEIKSILAGKKELETFDKNLYRKIIARIWVHGGNMAEVEFINGKMCIRDSLRSDTDYLPCPRSLHLWVGSDAFRLLGGNILKGCLLYTSQAHNEREKEIYSNEDIIPERSSLNVHFKEQIGRAHV